MYWLALHTFISISLCCYDKQGRERERGRCFPWQCKWTPQSGVCSHLLSGEADASPSLTPQSTSWVSLCIWVWCLNWCLKMHVGNIFSPGTTKNTEDIKAMKSHAYSWNMGLKTMNWYLSLFLCMYEFYTPIIDLDKPLKNNTWS